jgi:hypothetical protein
MMTPEQRYFFDMTGYLHLEGVLQGEALQKAQAAAQRYVDTPPNQVPDGFEINHEREHFNWYLHAFAFDKALEALTMHPATWPIIKELLDDQPRLSGGNMMIDVHGKPFHPLHSGHESALTAETPGWRRYQIHNGRISCNDLVFFFYLTDVQPGDGGLIILPGSHKANFSRPQELFYPGSYKDGTYNNDFNSTEVPEGVTNFTPKAGDVVIISELVVHGALSWQPADRDRRFLTLRYCSQHITSSNSLPDGIHTKLSPETLELIKIAPIKQIKSIVEQDVVTLS